MSPPLLPLGVDVLVPLLLRSAREVMGELEGKCNELRLDDDSDNPPILVVIAYGRRTVERLRDALGEAEFQALLEMPPVAAGDEP